MRDLSSWAHSRLARTDVESDRLVRRTFIPLDLFAAVARGLLADNAFLKGLDSLDDYEFLAWLARHGASQISLSSAWVRGAYDLAFSFENGDSEKPNVGAGCAIRALFRMVFTYKGSVFWKMQAGMGETVFTPLYLVLRQRGVRFKFFHKIEALRPTSGPDKNIDGIDVTIQALCKNSEYEPLRRVGRLDCWHHQPDFEQLQHGEKLRGLGIDFESNWSGWQGFHEPHSNAELTSTA